MANIDTPRGLWALRHLSGSHVPTRRYTVDASNAAAIFRGDMIKIEADGNVTVGAPGSGSAVIGVAAACYNANKKPVSYLPASTAGYIDVWDDPDTVFGIQADGTTVSTDIGAVKDHIATHSGNTRTGISGQELQSTDADGNQLKIIGKIDIPGNEWGAHVDLEALIVEHHYRTTSGI